ncbi:MAG: hypothetical protein ACKOYN_11040 [Planctomycetota bacterium]
MSHRRTAAFLPALAISCGASAVDLSVSSIEVTQGWQNSANTTALVAGNATAVRVKVSLNGQTTAQPGVDALLRVYSNGVEIAGSPVYSTNGPITAPVAPNSANLNDTLNFSFVPPVSSDIDLVVVVNPFRTVAETSFANNQFTLSNRVFLCRKFMELAYVPINYTLGGGLPTASLLEPGNGDNFLRGIYKTGDWNYHRSPFGNLTWSSDVNTTATTLLNTLNDIRQNQIPAAGFTRPEFIYGWLPGNPYSGNGVAIGIPGAAAFGNTQQSKYQRTFAHEVGHLWGLVHNTTTIGAVGFDVEHHLKDPLNIAQVMPTARNDIMVAGLDTVQAWVNQASYLDAINDARSACAGLDGESDTGGGANDAARTDRGVPALRLSGTHDHVLRRVGLQPSFELASGVVSDDNPAGNVEVAAYAADGALLHRVRVDTRSCRESCAGDGHLHRATSLYAVLPLEPQGRRIARVAVREAGTGRPLAAVVRSASSPVVASATVETVADDGSTAPLPLGGAIGGMANIRWSATDADGDAMTANLLYSPDGGNAWIPVGLSDAGGMFALDARDLPGSGAGLGRLRLRVSDGFNTTDHEFGGAMSFMGASVPFVHLISPNNATAFPQGAAVILHGSAWDLDDQLLPEASVTWTSSRDGPIGTGRLRTIRSLSVGTHVITVRGTDSDGMFDERSVTITVTARAFHRGDIDLDGRVGAADLSMLLAAWGGTTGLADIDANGLVEAADLSILLALWSEI